MSLGKHITVQNQISTMSPDDWEEFIEEWMSYKSSSYYDFERLGGAGDQGRDVVGYVDNPVGSNTYIWDNYQCKHYAAPLSPAKIWNEIAKICYYSFMEEYPFPRKYYFIAPLGIGTKLANLLKKPDKLKKQFFENWDNYCRKNITDIGEIELTDELKSYIQNLDFSAFDKIATIKIIMEHSKTQFHVVRFGVQLPERPITPEISKDVSENEITYVRKLLAAYDSHSEEEITEVCQANKFKVYKNHLQRSREDFANAETLRNFSRDTMPNGSFGSIQKQLKNGISDILDSNYPNGFEKVKDAVSEAKKLQLPITPLASCITVNDRGGICHQLANSDDEVMWCENE
ncbi:ABC-three component system protein [Chromohalobacter sp. 11-W]|uniref:ABC-three component system protein n=1 Tax=Chromohalobacter sp. 11-W TaxID=2994061 RepID=UPI002469ADB0|nr:ABC-three component system protein [Chromohalobacter sp. 11-W]